MQPRRQCARVYRLPPPPPSFAYILCPFPPLPLALSGRHPRYPISRHHLPVAYARKQTSSEQITAIPLPTYIFTPRHPPKRRQTEWYIIYPVCPAVKPWVQNHNNWNQNGTTRIDTYIIRMIIETTSSFYSL